MRMLSARRPELTFVAALIVLAVALIMRTTLHQQQPSLAVNMDAPASAPVNLGAEQMIARLQERIQQNPDDTQAYANLGLAFLQRVRETADPGLYARAEQAFNEALKRDPKQVDALVGQGSLALSRHQFADALRWGEQARALNPYRAQIYGVIGDAQTELGRYDDAVATLQKMIDTRPDLSSYTRVSYARELHGDIPGAIDAMQKALAAGGGGAVENTLWTQVQLGNLYFNSGDLAQAEATYLQALQIKSEYVYAAAGIAKVRVAQGRYGDALAAYRKIVETLPLPEFVIAYGELNEALGNQAEAQKQYDLVRAMQQLNASAGVDVDMELALFDADHGANPAKTVDQARAAYERRPSIYAADVLAWSLYRAGRAEEARKYSHEALKLGTRDALLHYHAGMIAFALGDKAEAQAQLGDALKINPYFSLRRTQEAQKTLATLDGGK